MTAPSRAPFLATVVASSLAFALTACASDRGTERSEASGAAPDAGGDAGSTDRSEGAASCRRRPWAPPRRVEGVDTPFEEGAPTLTTDELSIFFHVRRPSDGGERYELWTAQRATRAAKFDAPERLTTFVSDADDAYPSLTFDGLTLLFASRRLDPSGPFRLFRTERADVTLKFGAALSVAWPEASAPTGSLITPFWSPDRGALYFSADRGDGFFRLYRADRLDTGELGAPVREEAVDDAKSSLAFVMSADRRTMFVSRGDGEGGYRIHSSEREGVDEPFGPLTPVDVLSSGALDARVGWSSPEGCRVYLARRDAESADGNTALYVSER